MRLASLLILCWLPLAVSAQDRAWIERSDRNAAMVFDVMGAFQPEWMSEVGIDRFDGRVMDLNPGAVQRFDAAARSLSTRLSAKRADEKDARVRFDLELLVDSLQRERTSRTLEERRLIPYFDVPRHVFQGLQVLLDERNPEARRRGAVERLRRYAGMEPGSGPFTELARARLLERAGTAGLIWPYEGAVNQHLANCERYSSGIAELFRASPAQGWEAPQERLAAQLRGYCDWVRTAVLPRARKTPNLPAEIYADRLKNAGVDITPEQAIALGTTAFAETRDDMNRLAARIAHERKLESADYRDVLRALKRDAVPPERMLDTYRETLAGIEAIIVRERIVSLPKRPASIRLASEAESAAIPAPYFNAARLVGNHGEVGEFVLPLRNPNAKAAAADDFRSAAAAWTLTAHEARPGHELQFTSMVENGTSLARAVFASNSTNAEGWGLYAEAIMLPYFSPEAQLFSLQLRLARAARAFLDPMVNLGRMTPQAARDYLMHEVALSEAMAQQEADRYAFVWPGQAVSYLYGYSRLRELRLKAEITLGERFQQREFHDVVIAQGLLPPRLLERSVLAELARRYPDTSRTRAAQDAAGSR
jgi:hypothetical protein